MEYEGAWRVALAVGVVIGLAALALAWPALTALVEELILPLGSPHEPVQGGTL